MTIGRAPDNDIVLSNRAVSRHHAVVYWEEDRFLVEDLGSRNGTFVNGYLIQKVALYDRDKVRIGDVLLRFSQEEELPNSRFARHRVNSQPREALIDFLVELGIVDRQSLKIAIEIQKTENKNIAQVLQNLGVADEVETARILASQLDIRFLRLNDLEISKKTISLVPGKLAAAHMAVPVEVVGNKLSVAMANPLDQHALQDLRFVTGMDIDVAVVPQSDIFDAILHYYPIEGMNILLETAPDRNGG